MKRRITSIALAILLLALNDTGLVQAAGNCIIGSPSYPTIQSAINDLTCSEINIPAGTFYENLSINRDLAIQGEGNNTVIDGRGMGSVFVIHSGTVTLESMTITNGSVFGGGIQNYGILTVQQSTITENSVINGSGGGIANFGTMEVKQSTISNNSTNCCTGGGIYNDGTLTVQYSTIDNNTTYDSTGGISNYGNLTVQHSNISNNTAAYAGGIGNTGTVIIEDSIIIGNTAREGDYDYNGGGIINWFGSIIVQSSTISNNTAKRGGGIWNYNGMLEVTTSTINNNTVVDKGGGIHNFGGTVTINDSTLSINTADTGGGIYNENGTVVFNRATVSNNNASSGAGLNNQAGTVTFFNVTLSNNEALTLGGAIFNSNPSHMEGDGLKVISSTITDNKAGYGGGIYNFVGMVELSNTIISYNEVEFLGGNCSGNPITSHGYNLDSDGTCQLTGLGDLPNTDPLLGPLQDNGSPTLTHALLPGSPAIDQIPPEQCMVDTDQRGITRPQGPGCDIGAFEFSWITATVDITPDTLNLKSKGKWITVYIELPNGFDVATIDVSTLMLEKTISITPRSITTGDYDNDGIPDLMVKFSQPDLVRYLNGMTGEVTLLVNGILSDGTPFEGSDTITVINQGKK